MPKRRKARRAPQREPTVADAENCLRLLREAETMERVDALAVAMGGLVSRMNDDPTLYVYAIHIRNLAHQRRLILGSPHIPGADDGQNSEAVRGQPTQEAIPL